MIAFIKGTIFEKNTTFVVVENNGIGYNLFIPLSTFEALGEPESEVTLLTYLHVREDALTLYGFRGTEERDLFKDLLSVSGIGPKLALGILSGAKVSDIYQYIAEGNQAALTKIQGLGKKTAQRLILDLKDKVAAKLGDMQFATVTDVAVAQDVMKEASLALVSLGYSKEEAQENVIKAARSVGTEATVEELVTTALKSN